MHIYGVHASDTHGVLWNLHWCDHQFESVGESVWWWGTQKWVLIVPIDGAHGIMNMRCVETQEVLRENAPRYIVTLISYKAS